jgi:hypothetical protein
MSWIRRSLAVLTASFVLTTPAVALAQSAGDDQYQDPFGGGSGSSATPTPTPTAPSSPPPATPAPSTAAPSATTAESAASAGSPSQLPYTGAPVEAAVLAVAGALLAAGGITLRVRLRDRG